MKKSTRWVILFLVLAFLFFLAAGMGIGIYFFSQKGTVRGPQTLVFNVPPIISEMPPAPGLGSLFGPRRLTLPETSLAIRNAAKDDSISGLVLKVSFLGMGWGQIQEIRDALDAFRRSGKPVITYLEMASNREYYLATAADKIYMPPESIVNLGLLSQTPFFRRTLDKIKVEPQLEHVGKYKSGSDMFMRDSMTEDHRVSVNSLLDSIYGQMVSAIARSRSLDTANVESIIDRGLLSPKELLQADFIDDILYPDEVEKMMGLSDRKSDKAVSLRDYAGRRRIGIQMGRRIAVVIASGDIVSGKSSYGGWTETIGSDTLSSQLREVREDKNIAAVVLRINSPGGSGFASDLIWREVENTRKKKPVVVSMSDLSASGGYYIAMGADYIFAQPATLTGSIGVIAGKFVMNDLYDWAGITYEIQKRGENADIFTATQGFTEEQRQILKANLEDFYYNFVRKAAEGRKVSWDDIERVAQGRVWTGELAKAFGLVDELGGLQEAIDKAKDLAGIPATREVPLVFYPREKSIFQQFEDMSMISAELDNLPTPVTAWAKEAARSELFAHEPYLLLMPFIPQIR